MLILAALLQVAPIDYGASAPRYDGPGLSVVKIKRSKGKAKKVGKLMAAGRCDEAEKVALEDGDMQLVRDARELCRR